MDSKERAEGIDFERRACPNCGAENFEIRSEERLTGTCGLVVLDGGELDWDGYTDVNGNSQWPDYFFCGSCDTRLPDTWQTAIANALSIQPAGQTVQEHAQDEAGDVAFRCPHCGRLLMGYVVKPKSTPEEIQRAHWRREDSVDVYHQARRMESY